MCEVKISLSSMILFFHLRFLKIRISEDWKKVKRNFLLERNKIWLFSLKMILNFFLQIFFALKHHSSRLIAHFNLIVVSKVKSLIKVKIKNLKLAPKLRTPYSMQNVKEKFFTFIVVDQIIYEKVANETFTRMSSIFIKALHTKCVFSLKKASFNMIIVWRIVMLFFCIFTLADRNQSNKN